MVRAAPDRDQINKLRISVATAVAVGLIVFLGWFWWNREPTTKPAIRTIGDIEVDWVCEKDNRHGFRAVGGYQPVPCPLCDGKCYMSFDFACPVHRREFFAMVRMEEIIQGGETTERVTAYRVRGRDAHWIDGDCVRCLEPHCDECAERPRPQWEVRKTNAKNP